MAAVPTLTREPPHRIELIQEQAELTSRQSFTVGHEILPQDDGNPSPFSNLPPDLIVQIFSKVIENQIRDIGKCRLVCRNFRDHTNNPVLWDYYVKSEKEKLREDFGELKFWSIEEHARGHFRRYAKSCAKTGFFPLLEAFFRNRMLESFDIETDELRFSGLACSIEQVPENMPRIIGGEEIEVILKYKTFPKEFPEDVDLIKAIFVASAMDQNYWVKLKQFFIDKYKDFIPVEGKGGIGHAFFEALTKGNLEAMKDLIQFKQIPANGEYGIGHAFVEAVRQNNFEALKLIQSLPQSLFNHLHIDHLEGVFLEAAKNGNHEIMKLIQNHPRFNQISESTIKKSLKIAKSRGDNDAILIIKKHPCFELSCSIV